MDGVGPGALKEWFSLVDTQEARGPAVTTRGDATIGVVNEDHLSYFDVVGRIIGLSLLHNQPIGVTFSLVLCTYLLNSAHMKLLDPSLFQNLQVWAGKKCLDDIGLLRNPPSI